MLDIQIHLVKFKRSLNARETSFCIKTFLNFHNLGYVESNEQVRLF